MIQVTIDQDTIEKLAREAIDEKLKELDEEFYFMTMKQVLSYVNMSRNSFHDVFMGDPNFTACVRLGNKLLFNKQELDKYLDKFFIEVKASGGDIFNRKKGVV